MKITIESTAKCITVDGVPCRIWEGQSEAGVPVICFVTRIAVPEGRPESDYEQFQLELQSMRKPSPAVAAIPLALVL